MKSIESNNKKNARNVRQIEVDLNSSKRHKNTE